jgi:hypothetical protein
MSTILIPPTPEGRRGGFWRLLLQVLRRLWRLLLQGDASEPKLSDLEVTRLDRQLQAWARTHPQPSRRIFGFASGTLLSPLEIADAVHYRTPDGIKFIRLVAFALNLEKVSFDDFLESLPSEGDDHPVSRPT